MAQGGSNWWRDGIFYQIYPRSFQDSDGDGVGDLAGILRRLPYVKSLGVDAIWLSPIFPSPMADFGYDICDYTGIEPLFGTMEDFDAVLAAAHDNGLKLILDLVPNHTSDQHPWFVESRSSRDNPKRDWYIWRDPAGGGGIPNNWLSEFGGSAWQFDGTTGQYYYHAFLAQQPDLNWRNPDVRAAIYDVMRFWLEEGRRRLSGRRDLAPDQGRRFPRQSAEPALCRGPAAEREDPHAIFHRPAGGARRHRRDAACHRCA
ncbi:glycosidase [Bradyrhizobium sp. LM3.2]